MIQTERLELNATLGLEYIYSCIVFHYSYLLNSVPISLKIVVIIEVSTAAKNPPMQRLVDQIKSNIPILYTLSRFLFLHTTVQSEIMKHHLVDA
jgi:hypothetical protein